MIVKMKKASIIMLDNSRKSSLEELRNLGAVHLNTEFISSGAITEYEEKRQNLQKTLLILDELKDKKSKTETPETKGNKDEQLHEALLIADEVLTLKEDEQSEKEEKESFIKEIERLKTWGDFNSDDIFELAEKGIFIKLYKFTKEQFEQIPEDLPVFIIKDDKSTKFAAVVTKERDKEINGEEFTLGNMPIQELEDKIKQNDSELVKIKEELVKLTAKTGVVQKGIDIINSIIQFEKANEGMETDEELAYITGFIPVTELENLKAAASKNGWALLLEEPGEDDPVPTLVKNNKAVSIISPVFSMLGVTPGYAEYDISFWFLLFLSIFYAMIIGDAGYGAIFLVLTVIARIKLRKAPAEPFFLLLVTSVTTIIWGAITGTWFGAKVFVDVSVSNPLPIAKFLSIFVIPEIASFPLDNIDTGPFIIKVCFIIGLIHITIAHVKNFIRLMPKLKALSEIGWLIVVWGAYLLIQTLVVGVDMNAPILAQFPEITYYPTWMYMVLAGLGLVALFGEQKGNLIKGIGIGLGKLPLKLLDAISAFSDIISYVRLFAVGLATVKVAESFNNMASGVGFGFPMVFGAAAILFAGHALNIVMGAMSIVVHGVRLNMLEFAGHLGMEWTGIPYTPFKKYKGT
jgi:V/A-type H+/Na+-transporting ATPase subunit I